MSQKQAKRYRRTARKTFHNLSGELAQQMLRDAASAPMRDRLRFAAFVLFGPRLARLLGQPAGKK